MTLPSLLDLVERLTQATGPDRELDCRIEAAVRRDVHALLYEYTTGPASKQTSWVVKTRDGWYHPCRFTSSIDAALSLVPEGWTRAVDATVPETGIEVRLFGGSTANEVKADHLSEAIATVCVALKARIAMAGKEGGK